MLCPRCREASVQRVATTTTYDFVEYVGGSLQIGDPDEQDESVHFECTNGCQLGMFEGDVIKFMEDQP